LIRRLVALGATAVLLAACSSAPAPAASRLPTLPALVTVPPTRSPGPSGSSGASAAPTNAPSASASVAPTAPPTASPTVEPTVAPTEAPTDSPEPSPSASDGEIDPLGEAALLASLLTFDDVPAGMTRRAGDPILQDTSTTKGFTDNKGKRLAFQQLDGSETVLQVFDIRWQFPTRSTARAFFNTDNDLSEERSGGLKERTKLGVWGDQSKAFSGTDADGHRVYNYLIRVENVLGKIYVTGTDDLDDTAADSIAFAASSRLQLAMKGPYPSAAEASVLKSVPSEIRPTCERIFEIYFVEVESVRCRPADKPRIDYTLFVSSEAMDDAYDRDLDDNGSPGKDAGCTSGKYANTYTIGNDPGGRLFCVLSGKNRIIEWTDSELLILSYMSSVTISWADLYDFWKNGAGPNR
jgi:hypothetical protein